VFGTKDAFKNGVRHERISGKRRIMTGIPTLKRLVFVLVLMAALLNPLPAQDSGLDALVGRLQTALSAGDKPGYLTAFRPAVHDQEADYFDDLFSRLKMDRVMLRRVRSGNVGESGGPFYVQALFENSYAAIQETWQVILERADGGWQIKDKKIAGDISSLYKIAMPNDRVERVARIEVSHQDIRLTFTDALVFYDNIPEIETALIILGRGKLHYVPSSPAERHQLEMAYGRTVLDEDLDGVFLRFSRSFFDGNIRIEKAAAGRQAPVAQADINRAYSIFASDYSRSFTVENSMNGQLYSTLPQSQEALFELRTPRGQQFTYIYSPFAEEQIHFIDRSHDRLINLYSPPEEPGLKRMVLSFSQTFDVRNYSLDVDFTPATKYFSVKARLDLMARADHLDCLKLYLNSGLEILHITDGTGQDLFYTQDRLRNLLYIYLLEPANKDMSFSLEITYRGRLDPPEAVTDVLALPQVDKSFALIPITYETHFYTHSARWYPAPADEDYFTARLRFIIPPEYGCVANGLLLNKVRLNGIQNVEAIEKVGRSVYTFETKSPVKYLSFIVGKFQKEQEAAIFPPGSLYQTPSIYLRAPGAFEMSRDILRFFESLFGPFPFEKLDLVQRLWTAGGGNSPASFIILNEIPRPPNSRIILNSSSPVDLSRWKEYFLAHEIAHQWWGQGVTWTTYHDQWLSEGLAQFSAIRYLREKYGEKTYAGILKKFSQWTRKESRWGAISLGSRLSYLDFNAFQALIYDKASLILAMLQGVIGEEAFAAGLRDFFQAYKYASARTSQFRAVMEKRSGRDLFLFFNGWFDSFELPKVRVASALVDKEGEQVLRFKVEQQTNIFVFPLTVQWQESGRTERRTLVVDDRMKVFEFPVKAKPQKVRVDPDEIFPGALDIGP
jgi:hypothetical protein